MFNQINKMKMNPKTIQIKKHPFGKGFLAINLFGVIFTLRDLDQTELNHELIHSVQQRELLYIPFFIWYGIEWVALYFKYRDWIIAYRNIRFEKEAYRHEKDMTYLNKRKHYNYS